MSVDALTEILTGEGVDPNTRPQRVAPADDGIRVELGDGSEPSSAPTCSWPPAAHSNLGPAGSRPRAGDRRAWSS